MTCPDDSFVTVQSVSLTTSKSIGNVSTDKVSNFKLNTENSTAAISVNCVDTAKLSVDKSNGSIKTGTFIQTVNDYCCNAINMGEPAVLNRGVFVRYGVSLPIGTITNQMSWSIWYKTTSTNGPIFKIILGDGLQSWEFTLATGGRINVLYQDASPSPVEVYSQTSTISMNSGQWNHLAFSAYDDGVTKRVKIFINGVEEVLATPSISLLFTTRVRNTEFGNLFLFGYIPFSWSEFWLTYDEEVDFSDTNVYKKFVCKGTPADLGADGSTPTGTQPFHYVKANVYDTGFGSQAIEDLGNAPGQDWSVLFENVTEVTNDIPCPCDAGVTPAP